MDSSVSAILFVGAVLIFGGLLFALISILKHAPRALDVEKFRSRWMRIEGTLQRDDPHSYMVCVMEADKLLDMALRERGVSGKTMGERMKQYQGKWSNGNGVWAAHKLRNKLAHETTSRLIMSVRVKHWLLLNKR
ncbi:hypothetical protein LRY29_00935 [Candidatus Saccharibacteria bacterium]|nr:hypothetical protein [Candidatus Saccharibacteria bacterium]